MEITGQDQVDDVQTTTPLAPSATFTSKEFDVDKYDSIGVSVFLTRDTVDTDVDFIIEHRWRTSGAGSTYRQLDLVNLPVTGAAPSNSLDSVYVSTRNLIRIRLVNKTVNALSVTEFGVQLKPLS